MKILILGPGYVGKALINRLKTEKHELFATARSQEKFDELKTLEIHPILLDMKKNEPLQNIIRECDAIIILVAPKDSSKYRDTYLGTAKLVYDSLKDITNPPYVLYSSSTSVYENMEGNVTEDMILNPLSQNTQILLEAEHEYLKIPGSCILRLAGIFGPGRTMESRAKKLSGQILDGTGLEPTNNIHLDDIVEGIIFCLVKRTSGIYNLVNDDHPSRNDLYCDLCYRMQISPPKWDQNPFNAKKSYIVSNAKIKKLGIVLSNHFSI